MKETLIQNNDMRVRARDVFSKSDLSALDPKWKQNAAKRSIDKSEDADIGLATIEVKAIKAKYLGGEESVKKVKRTVNDKKKFVFDWNESEDTSNDINPIYQKRPVVQLLGSAKFGGLNSLDLVVSRSGKKEIHWSEKALSEMNERDWRIFKEDYSISIRGTNVPYPLRSWKESTIPLPILKVIEQIGYAEPTPIQRQAIPIAIQGRDIIGVAETGSGKTASFVIPMLCFIKDLPQLDLSNSHLGPYALILAPTRELALQIESEAVKFAKAMGFICVSIVGGHSVESQTTNLLQGAHIIIATPGRLRDLIDRRILALSQCVYVVMDEADRMVLNSINFRSILVSSLTSSTY